MLEAAIFLSGFLVGGLVVRQLIARAERRAYFRHAHYEPAARVAVKYASEHGTINHVQLARLIGITPETAGKHLEQMAREDRLRRHRASPRWCDETLIIPAGKNHT